MPERVKGAAIGIDLGTTNSCVGFWFEKKNRVEIIPNEQGNKTTPSFIAFTDTELLVGEGAKYQIVRDPTNTVFDVKRLIGRRFSEPEVQKDLEVWPFKIIEGPSEEPTVVVKFEGRKKKLSPEELSGMVLKKMKEAAEEFIGEKVTDAVITVPAYFNNKQREATMEAGAIAGLNVLRLINEPTAAAIAYGVDNMVDRKEKNVLVFDLGGGTFDVSVLTVGKRGAIDVKAVGGDTHLGGEDFDRTLVDYCMKEFKKKHKVDLRGNPRALARLKVACEKAKRDLSSSKEASIFIDCLYKDIDLYTKISRAKFEELNSSFFHKCIDLVNKCLRDGKIQKTQVDEVVMVGGSSRIPKVQRMMKNLFDGKTLCKSMNGDEAVAFGAAILAAELSGSYDMVTQEQDVVLVDVASRSLGILYKQLNSGKEGYMDVIIPRNKPIPTSITETYFSQLNETAVLIAVYQGENKKVKDNMLLGEFSLSGLTLGPNGKSEIEVRFQIDVNGILQVSAKETSTGHKKTITIAKT